MDVAPIPPTPIYGQGQTPRRRKQKKDQGGAKQDHRDAPRPEDGEDDEHHLDLVA